MVYIVLCNADIFGAIQKTNVLNSIRDVFKTFLNSRNDGNIKFTNET